MTAAGAATTTNPVDTAQGIIERTLGRGPQPGSVVLRALDKAGITESTRRRARERLGVTLSKDERGRWVWALPASSASAPTGVDGDDGGDAAVPEDVAVALGLDPAEVERERARVAGRVAELWRLMTAGGDPGPVAEKEVRRRRDDYAAEWSRLQRPYTVEAQLIEAKIEALDREAGRLSPAALRDPRAATRLRAVEEEAGGWRRTASMLAAAVAAERRAEGEQRAAAEEARLSALRAEAAHHREAVAAAEAVVAAAVRDLVGAAQAAAVAATAQHEALNRLAEAGAHGPHGWVRTSSPENDPRFGFAQRLVAALNEGLRLTAGVQAAVIPDAALRFARFAASPTVPDLPELRPQGHFRAELPAGSLPHRRRSA